MNTTKMTKLTKTTKAKVRALAKTTDALREQAIDARRALVGLGAKGMKQVEKHPVGAVVGAFATGMAVAKLVGRS